MQKNKWLAGPVVLGLAVGMAGIGLHAQPEAGGGGGRPDFRNMTPEQREQMMQRMQQMREEGMRRMLTDAGFADAIVQDAIIAFGAAQEKATQSLRQKMRQVTEAARTGAVTDAQMSTLLAEFRADVAAEKTRRAAAQKDLDTKVNFSKQPRLDALLTTMGLIGDEAAVVGGGGPGGGFGGGRGGGRGRGGGG